MNEIEFNQWADKLPHEERLAVYVEVAKRGDHITSTMFPNRENYTTMMDEVRNEVKKEWEGGKREDWQKQMAERFSRIEVVRNALPGQELTVDKNGGLWIHGIKVKNREGDQPLPTKSEKSKDVQEALLEMIRERREVGIQRYGSPLLTHNGRDALQDALEEAVDLSAYLMQMKMERDSLKFPTTPTIPAVGSTYTDSDIPGVVYVWNGQEWTTE